MLDPKSSETAPKRKAEVLRAVATERLSLRAAQRVFGVSRGTIALWLRLPRFLDTVELGYWLISSG